MSPMVTVPENIVACPARNICKQRIEEAPACGTDMRHLPPILLAEALCPQALIGAIELEKARAIPQQTRATTAKDYRLGSLYLDLALSPANDADTKEVYFKTASKHLGAAAQSPLSVAQAQSFLLNLYLPAFKFRRSRQLPSGVAEPIREGLLDMVSLTDKANGTVSDYSALGMLLLYNRNRAAAFPSTAREVGLLTPGQRVQEDHRSHSLYIIDPDIGKIPHRPLGQGDRMSRQGVMYVSLTELVKRAVSTVDPGILPGSTPAVQQAVDWLYDEAAGHRLNEKQTRVLDAMGFLLRTWRGKFKRVACQIQQNNL